MASPTSQNQLPSSCRQVGNVFPELSLFLTKEHNTIIQGTQRHHQAGQQSGPQGGEESDHDQDLKAIDHISKAKLQEPFEGIHVPRLIDNEHEDKEAQEHFSNGFGYPPAGLDGRMLCPFGFH